MAQPTFAQASQPNSSASGLTQQGIIERMVALLAMLASGQNPDASTFNLLVTSLNLPVTPNVASTNILHGYQTFTATTAATTLITIPQGRTWMGTIGAACSVGIVGASTVAGQARAVITVAGVGATPAAGTYFAVEAKSGANVAGGTVGTQGSNAVSSPFSAVAPAGNSITIQVTTTQAGTASIVDAWALGQLL